MKLFVRLALLAVVSLSLASCGMDKAPAQAALTTAQASFDGVKDNAAKILPDETKAVQEAIDAAKASFDKGDYKAATAAAAAIPAKVTELSTAVAAKTTELQASWDAMSAGMPGVMSTLQSRVDMLSKSKHLPAGLDQATFDGVKQNMATATQTWTDAMVSQASGDMATAVSKANEVKQMATDAMTALKMPVPDAMK